MAQPLLRDENKKLATISEGCSVIQGIRDHLEVLLQCTMGYSLHPRMFKTVYVYQCVIEAETLYETITVYVSDSVNEMGRNIGKYVRLSLVLKIHLVASGKMLKKLHQCNSKIYTFK